MVSCLLGGFGCASADDASGGGGGGGVSGFGGSGGGGPSARLVIESDPAVTLRPSEQASITVRYFNDNDVPVSGAMVSFTLVGSAQDSGLSRLSAVTDSGGRARTTLIAGARTASFQVRISAAGAQPVVVDAAVSDRGFGNLSAAVPYTGRRAVTQRRVALFAGLTCGELATAASPDRQANLTSLGDDARFIGLPAETQYAVLAVGFGAPAIALAQGCVDGVEIVADLEVTTSVTLVDLDLTPWGDYALSVELDTAAVADVLSAQVLAHAMPNPPGPIATPSQRLLTALDETLRSDPSASLQVAAADVLTELRDPGSADGDLQAVLDVEESGPLAVQTWLANRLTDELDTTVLSVGLRIEEGASEPNLDWTLQRAVAESLLVDGGFIEHLVVEPSASSGTATFSWNQDQVTAQAGVPSVFGALAVEVVDAIVDGGDGAGRATARGLIGCGALSTWVSQQAVIQDACDESCVHAACDRFLSTLLAGLQTSLIALDASRPVVTLDVTFDLVDNDADATVDTLEADMLDAVWEPDPLDVEQTDGTPLTGSAQAERTVVAGDT